MTFIILNLSKLSAKPPPNPNNNPKTPGHTSKDHGQKPEQNPYQKKGSGQVSAITKHMLTIPEGFLSTPVRMHGGLICIAFCPSARLSDVT